jgi:hypothetical protein
MATTPSAQDIAANPARLSRDGALGKVRALGSRLRQPFVVARLVVAQGWFPVFGSPLRRAAKHLSFPQPQRQRLRQQFANGVAIACCVEVIDFPVLWLAASTTAREGLDDAIQASGRAPLNCPAMAVLLNFDAVPFAATALL